MSSQHASEVQSGNRFEFGKNWSRFLAVLDNERICQAMHSLRLMLEEDHLQGKSFLDIGSGSGLFSLAARKLGATVHSFDYDPKSVACAAELKSRYFPSDPAWRVEQASVLDEQFMEKLDTYDVVYSWGVLHHTGDMERALDNAGKKVRYDGRLFIAIYNDQGRASGVWLRIKKLYNRLPVGLRWLVSWPVALCLWGPASLRDLAVGKPFQTWRNYSTGSLRGMAPWRDLIDWVGGYPFEVATPERIFLFFRKRGFKLEQLKTCAGGHGCNEFVFRRIADAEDGLK